MARAERLRDPARARGKVAPRLPWLGDPCEAVRHELAADQDHALVAILDLGNEPLRHDRARASLADGLDDDVAVRIVGPNAKHMLAPHDVEALNLDVALLVDERLNALRLARHECRYGEAREFADRHLFVVVADRIRCVEHSRALAHR